MTLSVDEQAHFLEQRPKSDRLFDHSAPKNVSVELLRAWPNKCAFVVDEILKTEENYVTALDDIIEGYRNRLDDRLKITSEGNHDILQTIFGNIDDLRSLHRIFLDDLKTHKADPYEFGRVFISFGNQFKVDTIYCVNYDDSLECLNNLLTQPQLKDFFIVCQRDLGHVIPLSYQLIKPIQRIMKYHLFLKDLISRFDSNLYGYPSLKHAHQAMARIADRINEVKKHKENSLMAKNIESFLTGCPRKMAQKKLIEYGDLILESTCRVGKGRVQRQVVLFENLLLILKKKDVHKYRYKGHIHTDELSINQRSTKNSSTFKVWSSGRNTRHNHQAYLIETPSKIMCQKWVTEIKLLRKSLSRSRRIKKKVKTVPSILPSAKVKHLTPFFLKNHPPSERTHLTDAQPQSKSPYKSTGSAFGPFRWLFSLIRLWLAKAMGLLTVLVAAVRNCTRKVL